MSLLEVIKPPAQRGIKIPDDLCQAIPTCALGLLPGCSVVCESFVATHNNISIVPWSNSATLETRRKTETYLIGRGLGSAS